MDATQKHNKVLFIDLDGTLIQPLGNREFPKGCWDMELKFATFEAIKQYKPDMVIIVTNQGGIEKGFVNEHTFYQKLNYICSCIYDYCNIDSTFRYCSTCNSNDNNRKPNPGMINRYIECYNIKKENCLMVGDREEDMLCAKNAGIKFIDVNEFTKEFTNIF
jgi:HAD superfamily hydrolase (TIGR01662 family)